MSVDGCKFTSSSSILLKKVRHTNNVKDNNNIEVQVKKSQSTSSFSRLQSVGLSLVASVTKKRNNGSNKDINNSSNKNRTATRTSTKTTSITATTTKTASANTSTTQNKKRFDKLNKHVSSNSLPSIEELELPKPSPTPAPPPTRLKPSISARPFSQFFFPTRDEEVISNNFDKKGMGHLINEREPLPQQTQPDKQKQQQQQQKLRARQQINSSKRHSIAIDFAAAAAADDSSPNSTTSSRSSSLKTVKNCSIVDNVVIATNDTAVGLQSEITFATTVKKRNLSRTPSQQQQQQVNRLSGVARARTVLGLDSLRSREMRAINLWKDTVSQLSLDESMMYGESNIIGEEDEEDDNDGNDGLIEILSHPALIPEQSLERQRFVRRSSPKELAMMKFILNELVDTEKSYNQLLSLIRTRYMEPMIIASQTKDSLVKSSDIPLLFNHLPQLLELSDKLLDYLGEARNNNIGHAFRLIESELVVFLKYAMHYRTNIKTIRKACSNVLFVKINQETLARRDSNRLGMSDYFIAPIQRIPRYCLLIKDLQKYTNPLDSNYMELDFALKKLTALARAMDHVQNKSVRSSIRTL